MLPTALSAPPPGFDAARALLHGLDDALATGFARLGPAQKQAINAFAEGLAGSPLGGLVGDAARALQGGLPAETQLLALAAGREALCGAMHDALLAQAQALLDRPAPAAPPAMEAVELPAAPLLGAARQWLCEMALGGIPQLDSASLSAFELTLQQLQEQAELSRPAALLTGFCDELSERLPLESQEDPPITRWCDLWSRSLLACLPKAERPVASAVRGRFSAFAIETRQHDHYVSAVVWGLWEPSGGAARVARTTLSGWRVPALAGSEAWHALTRMHGPVLKAIADRKSIVTEAAVLSTGELRLGAVEAGLSADPFAVAAKALDPAAKLEFPNVPACDRHPVQLAVPLLFEAKPAHAGGAFSAKLGDGELPLRMDWASPLQGLDAAVLPACERWMGLLRWDGGAWAIQPLCGVSASGKKPAETGPMLGLAAEAGSKSDALTILRERASRLLRQKS